MIIQSGRIARKSYFYLNYLVYMSNEVTKRRYAADGPSIIIYIFNRT